MRTRQLLCFLTAALVLLLFSFASYGEDRPFITRWKGKAGKELRIPINGYDYNGYRLIIKRASDGSVLATEYYHNGTYSYTPTEDGELLVEAGPERVRSIRMNEGSAEALLRVEQFGTVQWQTMENAFHGCKNMQFAEGIDTPDLSKVTDMNNMFSGCSSFNHDLGMWKLEKCEKLGLDNCGMSVENYSKSLAGWAAQANIKQGLSLSAEGLKYNASGKAARKQLAESKNWSISGDVDEKGPFITRWKGEAGKELRIPINSRIFNYKLVIKKASDGSVLVTENYCKGTYYYTPTEDGELLVEAGPAGVRSIRMNEGSAEALLRVEQFGTVQWQTMENAFYGCKNMQFAEGIDTPNLSQATDMSGMLEGCTSFNQPLNNWNVSQVTDMRDMFKSCTSFNQPLNDWDVSKVTNMSDMFDGCTSFNQPLNNWDVSQVTDMGSMFHGCTSFNQPLNNWNVSQVTDMRDMFKSCTAFNQNLGMWELKKCQYLGLDNCGMSVENYSKSLVGWTAQTNIKQGLSLSAEGLKYNASGKAARKQLIEEKRWSIGGDSDENDRPFITRWKGEAGKELRIPINGDGYKLIIKRASDGSVLVTEDNLDSYYSYYRYTPTEDGELLVGAGPEGVSSIRMDKGRAEALLRVEQFGTVRWQTMENAFRGCKNMQFAEGIDTPDLSQVTNMENIFSNCSSFNHDLGMWKLEKCEKLGLDNCGMSVENYSKSLAGWAAQANIKQGLSLSAEGLKYNASGKAARKQLIEGKGWNIRRDSDANGRPFITRWKGKAGKNLNIPIRGRDYKLVIKKASDGSILECDYNSHDLYSYTPIEDCELLVEAGPDGVNYINCDDNSASTDALLRVEQFGTVQWQTMRNAFRGCKNMQFAEGIDSPDLSQVTDMEDMFSGCSSFNQPLNNWNVSHVTNMENMFSGCISFNQNLGMWKLERCVKLGLYGGMSVENYSRSLVGWAAQANIKQGLILTIDRLRCGASGEAALKQLKEEKHWEIRAPFITRWKGEARKELNIPIRGNYKLVIKKASDGSVLVTKDYLYGTYSYTPIEDGELLVEAEPEGISSFGNSYNASAEALLRVEQFGTVTWQTMENAFHGCKNMQFAESIDTPDLSKVTDMNNMFSGCSSFNQPLNNWDVSHVTNMCGMFYYCTSFNQPLNNWDMSQVTDIQNMFYGCTSFNQPLNNWDVGKVWAMGYMFYGCTSFNQPLNNWDVSKATYMRGMFSGCISFNQPLNNWDVSHVMDVSGMSGMFSGCTSFNQPLNNWDVSKVTYMGDMFKGCTSFNQDLGMWKLTNCRALGLDNCGMSIENYSKSLEGWAAQNNIEQGLRLRAKRLRYNANGKAARAKLISEKEWRISGDMDEDAKPFITRWKGEAGKELRIPIRGENYKLVIKKASDGRILKSESSYTSYDATTDSHIVYTYTPTEDEELLLEAGPEGVESIYMLSGSAEALLRVEQFGSVQCETMENAFRGCKNLQFATGIDTPDLSQVTNMSNMFSGCRSFNQPLNNWNVSQVTNMSGMFSGCTSFNQPLNDWDVSKVSNMSDMFSHCSSFNQPLNNWDVSQVRNMGSSNFSHYYASGMFSGCTSFNQPLNDWDVSKVSNMSNMFLGCTSFNQPLNDWDVSKVTNMSDMFSHCSSFNQPLNNWDVSQVKNMEDMFSGCTSFNRDLGMWKLEECEKLGLDNCGMSVENYSKSLVGWASQNNIKRGLILHANRLRCNASGQAAMKRLIEEKYWKISVPFITRWKGEAGKELKIPIRGKGYLLVIKRASNEELLASAYASHSYSYTPTENGELLVEAEADGVESIDMFRGSAEALLRVEQFGTVQWKTMQNAFRGCSNMQFADGIGIPDLSNVKSMSGMFSGCSLFNQPLDNWDVSQVTNMENTFSDCSSFDQELGAWNLRCVKLSLDNCGMSAENYSKSLTGWASQNDIKEDLQLDAMGLKYFPEAATARNTLVSSKHWVITGDELVTHYLSFRPKTLSLTKGVEQTLVLTKKGIDASEVVTLTSSDPTTVQITDVVSLKIMGLKEGTATITATVAANGNHEKLEAKCEVTVRVAVAGVSLSQTELSLVKGATATLVATVVPANATNKNVSWRSDNAGIAQVENGVVTAIAEGQTYIRVVTEDGNFTTECKVTVGNNGGGNSVAVTGVKLAQNKLTLKKDDSFTLVATLEPSTASNKAVMWTTSNDAVVSVSDNGVIQAKAVGVAVITVTTQEGAFTATCEVTVTEEDVVLTGLRLSPSETRLKVGGEVTLSVTYEPAGATQREVTWSTSDAAIVTVDEHGKVKAIAAGEATITVASKTNASIQATCKLIVEPPTAIEDAVFASVVIAPNPFDNQLRIVNGDLRGTYALLNAQGVVVRSGNMDGNEVMIETTDLTSGLYLLRLTAENGAMKTITVVK